MSRIYGWLLALLLCAVGGAQGADFTLREELNRQWTHECVTFPLTPAQYAQARAERPLRDATGKAVVYQLFRDAEQKTRVAFQTDLAPLEIRTFTFADTGKADNTSDLRSEDTGNGVTLTNDKTGLRLTKTAGMNGPIAGLRLPSGAWGGGSRLVGTPPTASTVAIVARGPVFTEALCTLTFGDQGSWQGRFRLYAGEPVVLIDETSAVKAPVTLQLLVSDHFAADSLFFRDGDAPYGKNMTWKIEQGLVFNWEPWLRWHASVRRGSTFSVFNTQSNDLLTVAAGWAGAWVDPKIPAEQRAGSTLKVVKDDTGVHTDLPLKQGQRRWMLGAFRKDETLAIMQDETHSCDSPIPYKYLVKYGHFPLDMVKDYVLRWPSATAHPCMILTKGDVARFRAAVTDLKPYQQKVAAYLARPDTLTQSSLSDALPAYLATQDPKLGQLLAGKALDLFQYLTNYLIDQQGLPFGAAPHNTQIMATAPVIADIIYNSPETTPAQRERLRTLAAFLGYTTTRPDYWSPERSYCANPNMTTAVANYQAALASFIPDHPCAKAWARQGLNELKSQLDTWSDDNGGWLEAPSYALYSYDSILAPLLMAYHAGFNDWLYTDPKVKSIIRWFAKTSTPPDSRIGGFRHRPPVGNTYMNEPNGEFGILAYLYREKDPQFSAEMQWMFKQNNMYIYSCVGGFLPAFAGYRELLTDPKLPDSVPHYLSTLFPQTGLVLRDSYPSARETYLHLIQGDNHAHYDDDSGSIILYGKGRILADEFGYYGYIPEEDHSMVESPAAGHGLMHVHTFVTGPRFDYVSGVKEDWTRQIAMVKGDTPDAPCYYVMHDHLPVAVPAIWRLWLTAREVKVQGQHALEVGKEDVDMDIVFLTPTGVTLTTESKERQSGSGMFPNWTWGPMKTTQIGLIANQPHTEGFNVVLYPRLKTAPPPVCTPLAGGKGVKIDHEQGTDYVFVSATPFTFDEGDVHFSGTVGMAQLRGTDVQLALGAGGKISARGKTVTNDTPLPAVSNNLWPNNGDFENGKLDPLQAKTDGAVTLSLHVGNPVPGDTRHPGKYCAAFTLKAPGSGVFSGGYNIPVDPTRTYRISMNVYTDANISVMFGGYGVNSITPNVKIKAGAVWDWRIYTTGPTHGWKTIATTLGPEGSGAQYTWPPAITSTHLICRIGGGAGVFYLDDIVVEPQ